MAEAQLAVVDPEIRTSGDDAVEISPRMARIESHPAWPLLSQMPMTLTVRITLDRLKVNELLGLKVGQILESQWSQTSDVPLAVGGVWLGWSEFEVSGQQIGVRVTQLF
jgi:flagellar motor switch/type III secretory pathway protein FliN